MKCDGKAAGKITSNDYTFIYSGGNEHRMALD